MKISIIIPTRSGIPQQLKESLSNQTYKPDEIIEVIGSALTVQRNEGIRVATGNIILFLDDDIILDRHYLEYINEIFSYPQYFPNAIAVTGNVQTPAYKQNIFYTIFAYIFLLTYRNKGRFRISGFPENYHKDIHKVIRGEMLYGCNMAFRKEVFNEFSFCEDLDCRMFGEDDYFAWLLTRKYTVYYNPFAVCYDNRPYPRGKQALKIRHTLVNLIKRYHSRNPDFIGKMAFWWAFGGFIIFKIVEAIVMRDISIIKGMLLCFKRYEDRPLEDIRKEIKINKYKND